MSSTSLANAGTLAASALASKTRKRCLVLAMVVAVTTLNYADRATLSIAGPALSKELGIDTVNMGYVFSAFGRS